MAIPFKGSVTLLSLKGESYKGSLTGFGFKEEEYEASDFLFGKGYLVLETVVLFAAADGHDPRNDVAKGHLDNLRKEGFLIASYSLVEMDIVLKSRGYDSGKRKRQQALLLKDYPESGRKVHSRTFETIYLGVSMEQGYGLDYFDAMIAAEALEHDGKVV